MYHVKKKDCRFLLRSFTTITNLAATTPLQFNHRMKALTELVGLLTDRLPPDMKSLFKEDRAVAGIASGNHSDIGAGKGAGVSEETQSWLTELLPNLVYTFVRLALDNNR